MYKILENCIRDFVNASITITIVGSTSGNF